MKQFDTLLIANRGEIARRINRTARSLGLRTVAVYTAADHDALIRDEADRAVEIESYLSIEQIIAVAKHGRAGAVHPGYGFLSENAAFVRAVTDAGLIFVGPEAAAIQSMGHKSDAKQLIRASGVPTLPGEPVDDVDQARAVAADIGYPVLVKAAAGGGGRGLRVAADADAVAGAVEAAAREAAAAFGDGSLLLEKWLPAARHIEIQILADHHGHIVSLGERDCSVQRRHQKIIEEAPAPGLSQMLRRSIADAAIAAARAVDYRNAGTVEFLLAPDGQFYFLEMNTRLQVEHPVTEMVTGLDLVEWQLRIADGEPLPRETAPVAGHAIEARLYAEDPAAGFLPQTGRVLVWRPAAGGTVRTDHAVAAGQDVTADYDPMLAKIIAHAPDRSAARTALIGALRDTCLLGIGVNKRFLLAVLDDPTFIDGRMTTDFVEHEFRSKPAGTHEPTLAAAAVLIFEHTAGMPFDTWRNNGPAWWPIDLEVDNQPHELKLLVRDDRQYDVHTTSGRTFALTAGLADPTQMRCDGAILCVRHIWHDEILHLDTGNGAATVRDVTYRPAAVADPTRAGLIVAPMSGRVIAVDCVVGDPVAAGDCLAVIESMKIEHRITAPIDGIIASLDIQPGDQVSARATLARIDDESETEPDGRQ